MKLLTSAICMSIVMLCAGISKAETFTDPRDGQKYRIVNIDGTRWFAQNLNFETEYSMCYDNDPANCKKYGRLYRSAESVCPDGWRIGIPIKEEAELKARTGWRKDRTYADKYGFSVLPAGFYGRKVTYSMQSGVWVYSLQDPAFFGKGEMALYKLPYEKKFKFDELNKFIGQVDPVGYENDDGSIHYTVNPRDGYLYEAASIRCYDASKEIEAEKRAKAEREQARIAAEQQRQEEEKRKQRIIEERKRVALSSISSFTDKRDGQVYKTVKIGMQTWMAENLRFKTSEGFCDEKDGDGDCRKYGRYYYHSDKDDVCPESWHLPSFQEFDSLLAFTGYQRSKEGGLYPDKDITINDYGFSVLTVPASGNIAEFWVSDSSSSEVGSFYLFDGGTFKKYDEQIEYNYYEEIRSGYSVRCIKDSEKQAREKKKKKKKIDDEENFLKKNMGQFKDSRDGKIYKTIKIGNQIWMAQNLNYEYKKGFFETGNGKSYTCEETKGKCEKYGRFYNWEAAMKSCPTGWHLPSKKEFKILIENAGGEDELVFKTLASKFEWGKKGGLYENGFAALPAGDLKYDNQWVYYERDNSAAFWTSSKEGSYNAFYAILSPEGFSFNTSCNDCSIGYAFSVRCISDSENQSFVKGKNRK